MRRRLLNVLTVLSLLLCVAVCVLWVRSYLVGDALRWTRADNVGRARYRWYVFVASGGGRFAICRDAEVYELDSVTPMESAGPTGVWVWQGWNRDSDASYPPRPLSSWTPGSSFHFAWQTSPATVLRELIVPYWAVAVPAAALPVLRLVQTLRDRRRRPGFCRSCGYDLRASPARCPECGTARP